LKYVDITLDTSSLLIGKQLKRKSKMRSETLNTDWTWEEKVYDEEAYELEIKEFYTEVEVDYEAPT
jgi:hypothetical protein